MTPDVARLRCVVDWSTADPGGCHEENGTCPNPGCHAPASDAVLVAEIEALRFARLPRAEQDRIRRREQVIPLYAEGRVTTEVAAALGRTWRTVSRWAAEDPEIRWWLRAAYDARIDVWRRTSDAAAKVAV